MFQQALALREEMRTALSKLEEAEAQIEQATDRAHHLERLVETKDKAIRELTEATEKRIMGEMACHAAAYSSPAPLTRHGMAPWSQCPPGRVVP